MYFLLDSQLFFLADCHKKTKYITVGNEDETGKGVPTLKTIPFPISSPEHSTPFKTALQCNNYASFSYYRHSCQLQQTSGNVQLPISEKKSYRGKHSEIETLKKQ